MIISLDTSYCIRLFDSTHRDHLIARQIFEKYICKGIEICVSVIVVAEYDTCPKCASSTEPHQCPDLVRSLNEAMGSEVYFPSFNLEMTNLASKINFSKLRKQSSSQITANKDSCKDDVKIVAAAMALGCEYILTADSDFTTIVNDFKNNNEDTLIPSVCNITNSSDVSRFETHFALRV
jgi:predicted nucleic acid-binding protein